MSRTFEQVSEIQKRFITAYWKPEYDINGVGIGKDGDEYCLHVLFKTERGRAEIPSEFEGVKVRTDVVG